MPFNEPKSGHRAQELLYRYIPASGSRAASRSPRKVTQSDALSWGPGSQPSSPEVPGSHSTRLEGIQPTHHFLSSESYSLKPPCGSSPPGMLPVPLPPELLLGSEYDVLKDGKHVCRVTCGNGCF